MIQAPSQGVLSRLDAQVHRVPSKIAVRDRSDEVTYAELQNRSDSLARALIRIGVRPGDLVGICVTRKADAVACLFGILKAGAAFVPIDPTHPADRIAGIINDASLRFALANASTFDFVAGLIDVTIRADLVQTPADKLLSPLPKISLSDAAYVMFTSGSTGRPKGTVISHANVAALMSWAAETFAEEHFALTLGATSFCFDISVFEIFATLTAGGTLLMVDDHMALLLPDFDMPVTALCACSSALIEVVRAGKLPASLKVILQCGEVLTLDLTSRIFALTNTAALWNIYGPTETTVYSTAFRIPRTLSEEPPIGKALSGERCYILDADLTPSISGEIGELYIAGAGVSQGYLARPELTAERFLPDIQDPQERMYRTGDLVFQGADDEIRYVGRRDLQVKINGHRIELGEIEVALSKHPHLFQVAVLAVEVAEHKTLAIYAVTDPTAVVTLESLQRFLRDTFPNYMIPSKLYLLERMPYGPTGKIDRRALRASIRRRMDVAAPFVKCRDAVEVRIAQLMANIVDIDVVGRTDNFFAIGGHSLSGARLVTELEEQFAERLQRFEFGRRRELLFSVLGSCPTVEGFARAILEGDHGLADHAGSQRQFKCMRVGSPTNPPIFFFHGIIGGEALYTWNILHELEEDQSLYVIAPPGAEGDEMPRSIEIIAVDDLRKIRSVQPRGPYRLAGYCNGGLVAYDIACRLQDEGEIVESLLLLAVPGKNATYYGEAWPQRVLRRGQNHLLRLRRAIELLLEKFQKLSATLQSDKDGKPRESRPVMPTLLGSVGLGNRTREQIDNYRFRSIEKASLNYFPRRYTGHVRMIWGEDDKYLLGHDPVSEWGHVIARLDNTFVAGDHQFVESHSSEIVERLIRRSHTLGES